MVQVVVLRRNLPNIRACGNISNRPTCRAPRRTSHYQSSELRQRLAVIRWQILLLQQRLTKSLHRQRRCRPTRSACRKAAAQRPRHQTTHQRMHRRLGLGRGTHQHVANLLIDQRRSLLRHLVLQLVQLLLIPDPLRIKDLVDIQGRNRLFRRLAGPGLLGRTVGNSDRTCRNRALGHACGTACNRLLRVARRRGSQTVGRALQHIGIAPVHVRRLHRCDGTRCARLPCPSTACRFLAVSSGVPTRATAMPLERLRWLAS